MRGVCTQHALLWSRGMLQKLLKLKRVGTRGDDCVGEVTSNILRLEGTLQNHESQTTILVGCQVEHPYFVLHFSSGIWAEPILRRQISLYPQYMLSAFPTLFYHQLLHWTSGSLLVTKLAVGLAMASVVWVAPCWKISFTRMLLDLDMLPANVIFSSVCG